MMRRRLYQLLIFVFFVTNILGQEELVFTQISTKDGLAQNTVRSVLVDRQGYLWFGTLDGLVRYDGSRFITHKPKPGINTNLSDQRIKEIYEDKDGFIWVKKYDNSFSCYNPFTEQFIDFFFGDRRIKLPYNNILELNNGRIWLWSENGGVRIKKNEHGLPEVEWLSSEGTNGLTDQDVNSIIHDSNGNSWLCCSNGLNRVDASGIVTQFYNNSSDRNIRRCLESDGILYFLTATNVIYRYDINKKVFLEPLKTKYNCFFLDFVKGDDGNLLISTRENELISVDVKNEIFKKDALNKVHNFDYPPQFIKDENSRIIWIYDRSGNMIYYDSSNKEVRILQLISPEIASVIDDGRYNIRKKSNGVYWITTYGNGLYIYDADKDKLVNYKYKKGMNSPASDYLLAIAEDKYGNIWLGSEYAGVVKVTGKKYDVNYLKPEQAGSFGSSNNLKVVFKDSNGNFLLGTKNGSLYLYDEYLTLKRVIQKNINPYTILQDKRGRIWVGTKGNGIYLYNNNYKLIQHFKNDESDNGSLCYDAIFDILQDTEGRIWIASFGGGLDLVEESGSSIRFKHFFKGQGNISYLRCLLQDSEGIIWAGSYEGLISFNPKDFIFNPSAHALYTYNSEHTVGINCNDIKAIYEDNQKHLWIGTAGGGVNLFDKTSLDYQGAFIKYTKDEGLPSNIVTSIMESKDNELWVSTESGLSHFDKDRNVFVTYHFSNNSYGNFYNENACLLRDNGDMLWGTLDGLLVFDPTSIVSNKEVPEVILTDMYLFDQRIETNQKETPLQKSVGIVNEIVLKHHQNTFTLNFACLDLSDPSKNKYSFIMDSYDHKWSSPVSSNWVTYKNMKPGEYVFKVRGANAEGHWSNKITSCKIKILPPWWKTNYAIAGYILVVLLIAMVTLRIFLKMNSLNNAVKMEKQLTDYKLRFFTNISHEFRTPLTLIKGAIERLGDIQEVPKEVTKNVKLLNRNTLQMSRLIDQLLEFRKLQNNVLTLNLEKTDIREFTLNAYYAFKEIAFQKNIDYQFEGIEGRWDIYIDKNKVEKMILNLLSNAFKFTPANGSITCQLLKDSENKKCIISVIDTGVGIPEEKQEKLFGRFMKLNLSEEGTGIGLELVKEFAEVHKGSVRFEPNPEGGSIFTIALPADKEEYEDIEFLDQEVDQDVVKETEDIKEESIVKPSVPHQWKVLVIDDNYDIREYLKEELSHHCHVEVAEDGKEGLEKARTINPTLIICDVKMPEMDGLQVTRLLKDDFETSHIPIILLTALSSETIKLQGSESGADEYIMKPFSLKYLLSRVYSLIEQREKLKKHFSIDIDVKKAIISEDEKDQKFYDLINNIVDKNLSDPEFTVAQFTQQAKLSRTIFYKKVKGLTGYSPNELIKIKRMKKAAEMLLEDKYNVSEVSWQVGIEDPFYFSKCFKAQFGCSPSKYGKNGSDQKEG